MAEFRYPYEPSDMALDWRVALHLSKKARVARALEDIYSWRCKDRTSRTSKLSEIEALRFQRSVYRLSLLSSAYGVGLDYRRPESDSAFLRQLPTSQLEELWETIVFLGNLSLWTSRIEAWSLGAYETGEGEGADADQWPALGAYVGPEMVLDGFQRSSIAEVRKYEVYSYSYRDFLPVSLIASDTVGMGTIALPKVVMRGTPSSLDISASPPGLARRTNNVSPRIAVPRHAKLPSLVAADSMMCKS
ncbi:hypothetical protein GLOTRDRAFT_131525 [Gloeophyllum trabeum ATCC 11539]|uniref:Uncharacterized protein n=1 Tax=Gloeophyllum trabeum (strain ATCC 11539 / FP-39264 / Madison 617) TaxID=670483 RepID=S7PZZ4_GLOTA|nr:uncharacterized protein GLOTRDRAFT_131525 [Gloeophyllum trabeum ATCC 11539]EPQ53251.1 hypothetical protein GLOTRDRAFT_131525 [Gloeophyllum trabeum ATCC 11539]